MKNSFLAVATAIVLASCSAWAADAVKSPKTVKLIAGEDITVMVRVAKDRQTEGDVLFAGRLIKGERREIATVAQLFVECNSPEQLDIEISGKRYTVGKMLGRGISRAFIAMPKED